VLKNPTTPDLGAGIFYQIAVFGDFSAMYLLEITNLSGAFDLLIDWKNQRRS
jgi:hypothetical protein